MDAARSRLRYLDGLRGTAILCVVASNVVLPAQLGQFGLGLFFVLSGFCLSYPVIAQLFQSGATAFDVPLYAARRVVRIVPPYYAAIAVVFACAAIVPGFTPMSALDLVRKALFIDPNVVLPAGAVWSLAVYLRWYFFFPIALWLWTRSPRAFGVVILAAVVADVATRAVSLDLIALPTFLSGIVAAHVKVHEHRMASLALPASVLIIALATLRPDVALGLLWGVGAFLLVVAAGAMPWFARIFSMRLLTPVGYASFSIYLVGAPVVLFAKAHGLGPIAAGLAGVAAGFAFWFVAERHFAQGALRARLLVRLDSVCTEFLPRIGIGQKMQLPGAAYESDSQLTG